ncbi:hypothetical protein MAUB1S_02747 [Mycolicibacterium aubagnense]
MPRGFGDVHIHCHIQIQRCQRRTQPALLWDGRHRVAGVGDHRADLAVPGGEDFVGHRDGGQLGGGRTGSARTGRSTPRVRPGRYLASRGRSAIGVENMVPPARSRLPVTVLRTMTSQLTRVRSAAGKSRSGEIGRRFRGCMLAGQGADQLRVHPGALRDSLRTGAADQSLEFVPSGRDLIESRCIAKIFIDQHVQHAEQQVRVAAGAHRHVLVGHPGGLRPAGVDDDDCAAALADRLDAAFGARHDRHRTVRHRGVGAENHQPLGAVDIGDRDQDVGAEDPPRGIFVRHLVERGGREEVRGQQGRSQHQTVERARTVRCRVAQVHPGRANPVLLADATQPGPDLGEGLVPTHRLEAVPDPPHRGAQPVGIVVEGTHGGGLGADIALREDVVGVALDAADLAVGHRDMDSAVRLAQRALADVRGGDRIVCSAVYSGQGHVDRCHRASETIWLRA